ncbi:NADPH-dependent 2,4-dienoyl-CoA reductase/sulfur reductase-like enzyme [Okibacterium sp. HSC-33S16]|uniref:NAD(P)/FAD-dependent oxidoreductase n=1 Tax=Okibacterium sp. HSC-33S16 TaxID=2910965 RepID=UPI00209F53B1|nr:FAD-dependent oxidoreductase [Okibacterium sp. HSC-33S16]MCP2031056.1 NADPH-dependent 2,4-dienoyl-CoA reductase/sulfur reductase-like enzyme [Okibacterium sp. HSC-33S16]
MTTATPHRIVVVGNGIAGLTASDSLRTAGFDGELTIIGDEYHPPYSRPALSKAALLDDGEMTSHHLPAPTHEASEILGVSASSLDTDNKVVGLADGSEVPYDALVIASGSRARRLGSGDAGEAERELTLRTLDDALVLRQRIATQPSVVVLGGGALGMEIASGCLDAGCAVTLVSSDPPLVRQLGSHLSEYFLAAARRRGLTIATSPAREVHHREAHSRVVLADGSSLEAELVISAVGDLPNTEWLQSSGLLLGAALRVDSRGRVAPDIVAAGDVAAFPTARGIRRVPLWTSAIEQSKVAALTLVRGNDAPELSFQPYFWTEQFGLSLKASGYLPLAGDPEVLEGDLREDKALLRWSHDDGTGTAVAINYRIPIPKLRRLSSALAAAVSPAA